MRQLTKRNLIDLMSVLPQLTIEEQRAILGGIGTTTTTTTTTNPDDYTVVIPETSNPIITDPYAPPTTVGTTETQEVQLLGQLLKQHLQIYMSKL